MKIAILGAGTVGAALTKLFCANPKTEAVVVLDSNGVALEELEEAVGSQILKTYKISIEKEAHIIALLKGFDCLISALPSKFNVRLTQLALRMGINFIDLGGKEGTFEAQRELHQEAELADLWVIPNCGIAPGMLNILAMHGFRDFEAVDSIRIRSAGLPVDPIPPLNYQLGFSPVGLIEEYIEPALIVRDREAAYVDALDGYETLSFRARPDLGELEAFYVSSRITTLARELAGKVGSLDYKAVRYKGHRDIFKALFLLGFDSRQIIDIRASLTYRDLLIRQVSKNMPSGQKDFVVGKVLVDGWRDGRKLRRDYELFHEPDQHPGISAIMACTAIPVVCVAEFIADGRLPGKGGVFAPEMIVPHTEFIQDLVDKGLEIKVNEWELEG